MLEKILLFFCLLLMLAFSSTKTVYATTFFSEKFSLKDENSWTYKTDGGNISFEDGFMKLSSNDYYFPYVEKNLANILPKDGNFVLKLRFKYNNVSSMGDGIGLGYTGIGNINYFQFGIWNDSNSGSSFYYHDFNTYYGGYCNNFNDPRSVRDLDGRQYVNVSFGTDWHDFEINKTGTQYKVFIDKDIHPDPIFTTDIDQCVPNVVWFGNKMSGGSYTWTDLYIDDLYIGNNTNEEKIIIIPGLGASWNPTAMLSPIDDVKRDWKMTPFVKNYDNLIKAFKDKGLVDNQDFYVWNYDWRKPINSIVSDFNSYIDTLGFSDDSKINIIGHSLGGVVGRIWSQENKNDVNLGKIITLGSPNFGAIGAYEAWNGGKIPNSFGIAKIGLNVLLKLQSRVNKTKLETVHSYAPVLKDLLPVFDFAKKKGMIVPYSNLFYKNTYLSDKNNSVSTIFENLEAISGYGFNSVDTINLGERNVYDKVLGYWIDGLIDSSNKTSESDGTVLKKSAIFSDDTNFSINFKHSELPDGYISGVFESLGLGITAIPIVNNIDREKTVFYIGSHAYLDVSCDNGIQQKSDEMGFVTIDENGLSNCEIKIIGTKTGNYNFVLGNSDNENSWQYFQSSINESETKTLEYDVKNGVLASSETNRDFLYEQLINGLNDLKNNYPGNKDLDKIIGLAKNKQINNLTDNLFKFRKTTKDNLRTDELLGLIETIVKIENKNISKNEMTKVYKKAVSDKSLVDRFARLYKTKNILPNKFGANSYKLLDEKMLIVENDLKLQKLSDVYSRSVMISKLSAEVW